MIEAMKQALAFVEANHSGGTDAFELMDTLRQAIAEVEKQEPIAWTDENFMEIYISQDVAEDMCDAPPIPLYTYPHKREWVGLTDEDILDALQPHYEEWEASELLDVSSEDYKLIEAKLKEKNT